MTRRMAGVLVAIVAFLAWTGTALAQNRMALVIGNSAYQAVSELPNPINDARVVTQLLQEAGFEVTVASDLGLTDMRRTVEEFAAAVAGKGSDTIVLVFYAGHGLQLEGENFLVPIDAKIEREQDVAGETMRLVDVVKSFESAQPRMLIVMLDACRNNPFAAVKGAGRGLATVDAPTGSLVAYSTAPGAEAEDGAGTNSPYTTAFVDVAKEPGLQIEQLFKRVRLRVHKATERRQTPWESSSLTGDFVFFSSSARTSPPPPEPPPPPPVARPPGGADVAPRTRPVAPTPVAPTPAAPPPQPLAQPEPPPPGSELPPPGFGEVAPPPRPVRIWADEFRTRSPEEAYDLAIEEDSPEVYEEFIRIYPAHPQVVFLRGALTRRVEAIAWRNAAVVNTPEAYRAYLTAYPRGNNATEALRLRERPRVRPVDPVFIPRVASRPPGIPQTLILPGRPAAPVVAPSQIGPVPSALPRPGAPPIAPGQPRPAALPTPAPGAPGAPGQPVRPGGLPRPAALPPAGGVPPGQVRPVPGQPARPGVPAAAVPPGQVLPGRPGTPAVAPGQVRPVAPGQIRPATPTAPGQPARPIAVTPPPGQAPRPQVVPGQVRPSIPAQVRPAAPAQVRPAAPPQIRPAQVPAQVRPPSVPAVRPTAPQVRPAAAPARPAAPAKPAPKCTVVNGKQICAR